MKCQATPNTSDQQRLFGCSCIRGRLAFHVLISVHPPPPCPHFTIQFRLYGTRLLVSGINASILRLSRRDWTRLHVRAHTCLVICVPESHICMQSATSLSCCFSRDCGGPGDCL